jgi:hypothetical protein
MKKKSFRSTKSIFVLSLLLVGVAFSVMPTGSARLLELTPNLIISYDTSQTQEVITPIQDTLKIDLFLDYQVTGPLIAFGSIPEYMDLTTDVYIDLEIDTASLPEYVSASITPNQASADISQELTRAKQQIILFIKVDENAPGFFDFNVRVKARARPVNGILVGIPAIETIGEIYVQPNFAGLIAYNQPKGNYMEIGPADTADFPIQITNLGNAPTLVNFGISNIPEGWVVSVQESLILDSGLGGKDASKTVVLRVKPPYGFGYHNERQTIKVELTSSYYRDQTLVGLEYDLLFTVDNRGFSTPPFETSVIGIIIALIVIVIYYFFFYRRKKK